MKNKIQKFFTGFLVVALTMTCIPLPVQAANTSTTDTSLSSEVFIDEPELDSDYSYDILSVENEGANTIDDSSEIQEDFSDKVVSETISDNTLDNSNGNINLPSSEDLSAETDESTGADATNQTSVIRFYDDDQTTLLVEYKIPINTSFYDNDSLANFSPISKGHLISKWYNMDTGKTPSNSSFMKTQRINPEYNFSAVWSKDYYSYSVEYDMAGGSFKSEDSGYSPSQISYDDEPYVLPSPIRKGYRFDGWYLDNAYTQKITQLNSSLCKDGLEEDLVSTIHIYAKWISCTPAKITSVTAKNNKTGQVIISYPAAEGAIKYEIKLSTDKKFKKAKTNSIITPKTSYTLTNMPKGKTYYFKVRAINTDSIGENVYSSYSPVTSCKIKKGVKEYKATSKSGKLKKVTISNQTDLSVKATITKRLKSSDDSYYLVTVDPTSGKVLKKIAQSPKLKSLTFTLPLRDSKGTNLIEGKYAIAIKNGKSYKLISSSAFIDKPEKAALYTDPFPVSASKKGLQGAGTAADNVHQTFINIDMNSILNGYEAYKYNGKTYHFSDPWSSFISSANSQGMTITGQIMIRWPGSKSSNLVTASSADSRTGWYALDCQNKAARETYEAAFNYMAEKYSQKDCHLDNWVLGNEVNAAHHIWYYAGGQSDDKFMKNYADMFRILYYAVKSHSANSRVYICTDHTWINRDHGNDWGAKPFMNAFNAAIKKQNKNIQWNLAYHAYPSVLTYAAVWNDNADNRYTTSDSVNSDFVSPLNLHVLTDYVKTNFGSNTRIIISEVGFTDNTGNDVQAAALAYSYYKAEFNDMIDSFIIQVHNGGGAENYSISGKPAEKVFKYMNTPSHSKYTDSYLKTIGASSWDKIIPGYNAKKLDSMPK